MKLYYDPGLRKMFPVNTHGNGPVLNKHFEPWQEHIELNLKVRDPKEHAQRQNPGLHGLELCRKIRKLEQYDAPEYGKLFAACLEHRDAHSLKVTSKDVLAFVHPLYAVLSSMRYIEQCEEREIRPYLDNFFSLLKERKGSQHPQVVLFDTIHHYAAATSLLLEKRLVDTVLFTEFNSGELAPNEEILVTNGNDVYIGGAYNNRCLKGAIYEILKAGLSPERIWAIGELILDSPQCKLGSLVNTRPIIGADAESNEFYFPDSRILSLGDLVERLF